MTNINNTPKCSGNTSPRTYAKNWCLTIFEDNPVKFDEKEMQFLIYQREKCPTTEKKHYQTYIQFKTKKYFTTIKKLYPNAHIEVARGSPQDNIDYCSKEETRIEKTTMFGTSITQGTRTDLKLAYKLAAEGKFGEIDEGTAIKYSKGLKWIFEIKSKPSQREHLKIIALIGESGSGKSYLAHKLYPEAYCKPSGPWFDGYTGEKVAIFDEIDCVNTNIDEFLRWIDIYPLRVPIKGGFVSWNVDLIIITKIRPPKEWYPGRYTEVERRITRVIEVTTENRDELYNTFKAGVWSPSPNKILPL